MANEQLLKAQLTALDKIVRNTGEAAKAISGGRQTGNFAGGDGENDKLKISSIGLLKGFKDLIKHSYKLRKAQEKLVEANEDYNEETVNSIESLGKAYELQRVSSQSVADANKNLKEFVDSLGKDLLNHGFGVNDLSIEIEKAGDDFKAVQGVLDEFSDSLKKAKKAAEENVKAQKTGALDIISGMAGGLVKAALVGIAGFAGLAAVQISNVLAESLAAGVDIGGPQGLLDLGGMSMAMGISPQEAQKFAAQNRDIITSLTTTASIAAHESIAAVEKYGNVVRDTFGAIGTRQLNLISKGMESLANVGTQITPETFAAFNQGVENMAKTSNLSADELFTEFGNLSEMEGMQALMLSLGEGANMGTVLSETFLSLQKAVGMNATEFIKHRRRLAEDSKKSGADRVVQGAFTARLLESLGGFTEAEIALVQTSKTFRESLSLEDQKKADVLEARASEEFARQRIQATKDQEVGTLTLMDTLNEVVGLTGGAALAARREAGVTKKLADFQAARLAESEKETDPIRAANIAFRELLLGFRESTALGVASQVDTFLSGGGASEQIEELAKEFGDLAPQLLAMGGVKIKDPAKDVTELIIENFGVPGLSFLSGKAFDAGKEIGNFIAALIKGKKDIDETINLEFTPITADQTIKFVQAMQKRVEQLTKDIAEKEKDTGLKGDKKIAQDNEILKMMTEQNRLSARLNGMFEEAKAERARATTPTLDADTAKSTASASPVD